MFSLLCNISHVKSKSKPGNSKPKSLPHLTVYYTNVRGEGKFHRSLCSRTTLTSLLSVKPTCMMTSRTLISNCLATCQSITRMLGICTSLVVMLRAIFRLLKRLFLKMKTRLMCFVLALLHSATLIFFLYRSPSSSSCSVALILQTFDNIVVCGDFNAHNTEWLCHFHTIDVAGLFCQESAMAQDLTQIVDFPTRIPDRDDHQPYLLDIFLCSNPDSCTVASHHTLGKSDHMIVGVDVKFVVKSTNEHPYHRTIYSYSKEDWDGLRDHLRVPWLDIFKHNATYAAKDITEWVEIGIDCYVHHRKFQLKPHSSPWFTPCATAIAHCNHISISTIGMQLLKIRNCFVILVIIVRESSKMRGPVMLKQLVALLHLSLSDLMISGGFVTELFTGGSLPYLLFLMAKTKLGIFHAIPPLMMVPNSFRFSISYWTDTLAPRMSPKWFLVQSTILMHLKPLAQTEFQPLSLRFLLFLLSYTINSWPNLVFLPVGNLHRLCQISHPGKYHPMSLFPIISKTFEYFINDNLTKHLNITGLFSDLQYGFRAFWSTADILTVLIERIYKSLDAGGEMMAIALAISKAFDKVWHTGLLHKIKAYGVVGQILNILESFFAGTFIESCSWWPVFTSSYHQCRSSLRISFEDNLIPGFINDLPNEVLPKIGMYADDTTLYSSLVFLEGGIGWSTWVKPA